MIKKNDRLVLHTSGGADMQLNEIIQGYKKYQVLYSALELGIFDYLAQKKQAQREEISQALNINGMFSRGFLQSLVEMGLLEHEGENYTNSIMAESVLVKNSDNFKGDWFKSAAAGNSHWGNLSDMLTKEKAKPDNFQAGPGRDFIKALAQRCLRGELQAVVRTVSSWSRFQSAESLIDIGGGHGLYAIALCQENPRLTAAVFDKPFVSEYTREFIERYGMQERIDVQCGDITSDNIQGEYDIVLLSHLLYKFRKDLSAIFHKIYGCLKPGGLFVSNHWFCAPGCTPNQNGILELDVSIHSFGHPLCHIETFEETLRAQGFSVIQTTEIPGEFGSSKLHMAEKCVLPESEKKNVQTASSCCC